MFKKVIVLAIATAVMSAVYPCGAESQEGKSYVLKRIKERGVINMGHREASIPFSYIDKEGDPIGYHVEICNKFVEEIREMVQG